MVCVCVYCRDIDLSHSFDDFRLDKIQKLDLDFNNNDIRLKLDLSL